MLVPTNTPSVAVKSTDPKMARRTVRLRIPLPERRSNVEYDPPAKHDEKNRVSRNRGGKEREDHKRGQRREGDGECACEDEIGQIGGYENRRT